MEKLFYLNVILFERFVVICTFCSATSYETFLSFLNFFIGRIPGWSDCITVASVLRNWMAEALLTLASQV